MKTTILEAAFLAVAFALPTTGFAQEMDHSEMDHSQMTPEPEQAPVDESADETMDHSKMDHSKMDHAGMHTPCMVKAPFTACY